jgi:hypothetical protein
MNGDYKSNFTSIQSTSAYTGHIMNSNMITIKNSVEAYDSMEHNG